MTSSVIGQRFGRLVVVSVEPQPWPEKPIAVCKCDCGGTSWPRLNNLRQGNSRSCGCLRREIGIAKLDRYNRLKEENDNELQVRKAHRDQEAQRDPSPAPEDQRAAQSGALPRGRAREARLQC
jgi:hypothetical protein